MTPEELVEIDVEASPELFIGLVTPIGVDAGMLCDLFEVELNEYAYESDVVRLSELLSDACDTDFSGLKFDEYVWAAMSAGNDYRQKLGREDALALEGISYVTASRTELAKELIDDMPASLGRYAFIFRSLKTVAEVETMRDVYGSRFILVGAQANDDVRQDFLSSEIEKSRKEADETKWVRTPDELISRDYREEAECGQQVSKTFHRSDFFIRAGDENNARIDIRRILAIVFGDPFRTPTRDEYGQFQAAGAARRSSEMGRQVGAAIRDDAGSVISLGTNEVPRFGGGSHWEEDLEESDNREFAINAVETNRREQESMAHRIADQLIKSIPDGPIVENDRERIVDLLSDELVRSGMGDITEFGRAVHAEMDALLDAARRGISVNDCIVHSTTFPCHNCTRHLIAAGIKRVVFIEPYPKSKSEDLHSDSIAIATTDRENKVLFDPFVGVAPRRFLQYFDAAFRERRGHLPRKNGLGERNDFKKKAARPVLGEIERPEFRTALPIYRLKEVQAISLLPRE